MIAATLVVTIVRNPQLVLPPLAHGCHPMNMDPWFPRQGKEHYTRRLLGSNGIQVDEVIRNEQLNGKDQASVERDIKTSSPRPRARRAHS